MSHRAFSFVGKGWTGALCYSSILYYIIGLTGLKIGTCARPTTHNFAIAQKNHSIRLWSSLISNCQIIYFVHIPKTGGSSVNYLLKTQVENFHAFPKKMSYAHHGQGLNGVLRDNTYKVLIQEAERLQKPIVFSAEVGIDDLMRIGYPWFNQTCFFSILREPYSWVLSADNHMKIKSNYQKGLHGNFGYFDQDNIQSRMVNFYSPDNKQKQESSSSLPYVTCVTRIDTVEAILTSFTNASLPHNNTLPHSINITEELRVHVQEKYNKDLELWNVISEQQGILCW